MSHPRGSLQRHQPRAPADEDWLYARAREAWREQGLALLNPDEIANDYERQVVINLANRRYGKRPPNGQ